MFGWSPPNILATLALFHSLLLHLNLSPIQAKPYPKQDLLSTYTTGNLGGLNEGDWPDNINYKDGDHIERDKRSPTEVEDELPKSSYEQLLTVEPQKRQGIETPIQPLTSDSGVDKDTLLHLNTEENVRSKVDQPESESIGVPVEEEKKGSDNGATDSSVADHRQGSMENSVSSKSKSEELKEGEDSSSRENENNVHKKQEESGELQTENNGVNDKADSSSDNVNSSGRSAEKNSANVQESKTTVSTVVDENAQVRSVQDNADESKKMGSLPNDKNAVKFPGSPSQLGNSVAKAVIVGKQASPQEAQTLIKENVNKQVSGDETKTPTEKLETQVTTATSGEQNAASALGRKENLSTKTQSSSQESEAAIHTVPQIQNAPVGPIRDALGNSGSEIVKTRGASDLDSYAERDGEAKPSNGPEVGHFQVDDKSADLEINANSAGVKVKAKPASLQVVSRPGSHSASAAAQERSFYHHYHYPPYHLHHHWYPGMRRSYGHFHRRHFYNPYHSYPERRGFESFYDDAPFYRRHLHYWYPHHHRHHFRDSYLYERSRMEEPEEYPEHHGRKRHKRRFRHMNGPFRRQFYNNIPIMNGMESPQMGMMPEEGTMPQLPIGGGMPFTQRQNIITPMPPPINVAGNPPPGLLGGVNPQNFMMNGMNGLNNFNSANQMNNINAFGGINDMSNMGTAGLNSLGPMGAMEGLPGGVNGGMQGMAPTNEIPVRSLGARNVNSPSEAPRMAFKKTKILSGKKNETDKHDTGKAPLYKQHGAGKASKRKVNIKSWEKTLKRYHRLNVFTSRKHERHQYRRNAKSDEKKNDTKTHSLSHPHAQQPKEVKGNRKNSIVMHRPPIIYHPPPEIYHRPDIVVHRAPIMLHRPPIIYHQPPVVVHRPAIIYHQPPIVFHQPPPVVHQPILHSHDTWVTKPMVYHTASMVSHAKTYYGIPSHVYSGDYGEGCHGAHCSYRKGKVPHQAKNSTQPDHFKKTKRDSLGDYMAYFTNLWKPKVLKKREIYDQYDFITSTEGSKEKLSYKNMDVDVVNKRDTSSERIKGKLKLRRETEQDDGDDSKDGTQNKKKKDVVVNRPPIIYHPPPEIYHRPDIVVHRPPLVIHRPPIIYHQPPVIVHRPAVVYHQPPIVFHQPPPAVSQPLLYSHDSFTVHPSFYATHHGSVVRDFGHYVGVPNVITNYGNPLFGRPPPIGKRSKIEGSSSSENATVADSNNITAVASKKTSFEDNSKKAKNETNEKAGKKNTVIVRRPPIIYHPPPEIYHRPIIVVHRPPIMIHRAPIFYHQPPVVVHRPAIVYHQPPLVFHQPPPMVHQPVLKSHDTWISHPVVVPYSSRVLHHHTYVGVPDAYTVHHFGGGHGYSFYKSHILKHTKSLEEEASARNKISGDTNSTKLQEDSSHKPFHERKENVTSRLTTKKAKSQKGGKKNAVIVRRPPVIYHPPPEIYHRPEIVVHRAPIVIHRAPIIYHQPPVIVHRPAIVYHQPALIFHQPPPVVHQPVFRSHDTYVHRPLVRLYGSRMHHVGHLYHIPHAYYHGHGGGVHYMAYGKSKVPAKEKTEEEKGDTRATVKGKRGHKKSKPGRKGHRIRRKHIPLTRSKDKTETGTKLHKSHSFPVKYHKAKEVTEKANKKNSVVIHRPPIIYHPPPEIYHRPDIVVHRAPIVLYRAPIIYHQPPVVVHRPAIVYHQPPIVFHQPPPMVHQPVLHSHDTWVTKPVVIPYASHVRHVATYKGVPHEEIFMHGIGTGAFGKSHVPMKATRRDKVHRVEENDQDSGEKTKTKTESDTPTNETQSNKTEHADGAKQNKDNSAKLGAGERIARALSDSLIHKQWETRSPVGAQTRIQRSLHSLLPYFSDPVESGYSSEFSLSPQRHTVISGETATRIQRSIDDVWSPYTKPLTSSVNSRIGASARIQRALADPRTTFEDKKSKKSAVETDHDRKKKDSRKKKKDVVVNRPPIIYHPPPEVYHRPDIVVHRAPILIHRPPIVYHQPPVVVHRPAVVYHQPPIVFHQPAPAVNQPVLYSHDSFVVHPMAFASHMGSVVNDAGHYVGLPHGGVTNYPGNIPHGPTGHMFPTLNQAHWARRTEVSKPQGANPVKNSDQGHLEHQKYTNELKDHERKHLGKVHAAPTQQKSKHTKGERKNKVIVARPPMIYHPPPEIYDRPDIVVHRPDIVIHRPSIVYHQPSVVVHRAPVVYQQPPVVFHQPSPMVSQPIYNAHDTYVAHPVFHPQVSHIAHSSTYVGAPHLYPGYNDYGWGLSGHLPAEQTAQYHYASNYGYSGINGYTPSPAYDAYGYSSYGPAFGRSEVENSKSKSSKKKHERKHLKDSFLKKNNNASRKRRSAELSKRHLHHHHRHHHHSQHHRHSHHHRGSKRFYHLRPISAFAHPGHRKNVVIIHRPPLIYHPPPQVYRQPDILMHLPPLVYNRPAIMFQQPPTIVHHPPIIYHQPPVVFHNPPPIIHTPVIHSHEIFTPHAQHIMVPTSPYLHPSGNYFGSVVQGTAYGKSHIERMNTSSYKIESETKERGDVQKTKPDEKREASRSRTEKLVNNENAKKQNVGLVVHQPPIVYHPPPDIFDKPTVVMHPPPLVVHRPPILIHRAPVVVHRPPVIIHRPPIVLHHPTPVYHVPHLFHPMRFAFGKSSIEKDNSKVSKEDNSGKGGHIAKSTTAKEVGEKSEDKKGERKNLVVVHRPPMIYHPPPEIYDRPNVIMHRPDIVVHRPSIVYHQPSVVVHRPPIIYRQPPIIFHQPPPMINQPIMHAHDTYLAHPIPVPYTSQIHHAATYVGAPHYFHHQPFGAYVGHAFGKSAVEKVENTKTSKDEKNSQKKTSKSGDKFHSKLKRDTRDEDETKAKSSEKSKGHKKNKVVIARPPMIYHPPAEIYDRPNIVVHRPDIVIHRPSIVYHQPSVVVHRPPVIYQQPPVVFHQPPPLVHQPIMHAHDTYVAHPVPVPYSSHIQHTSTYVGSPHHYPGGWNYGWSQPRFFSPAFGKSKVPKTSSESLKGKKSKESQRDKHKRAAKDDQTKNEKEVKPKSERKSKKKNQVVIRRPPLIYHPPPEVYHKPDVVMHRPDIVIHRPSVVYHQPSVVVHRPPVVYQQPPVVFHQPSPTVSQPIFHAHDTYLSPPYFTPYTSSVSTGGNYVGAPHFYGSGWGMGGDMYGFHSAFGKSDVAKVHKKKKKQGDKEVYKGSKRTLEQEAKSLEDAVRLKNETKTTLNGNKKNLVIMRRPPLIYHPPPEVYHKPDVVMHRPDIVIHRPSIVFHQPSVVVHRPPVIYHQPPVVFHQPSPMVHQPIFHSHDTYLAHPHFVPFASHVHHTHSYVGAPHFYPGDWGWEGSNYDYGFHHAFGKSKVEKAGKQKNKSKNIERESEESRRTLHRTEVRKISEKGSREDSSKGNKKNLVVMHRPPLIYHPPPEIYHRPDIVVHRPDLVIHRPSVVFHQPSVVVHRPPVIYHQPPVVFHQPSPMVHQPIFHAHETYLAHPHFVPFMSHLSHAGSYVGAPHFYPGHFGHGIGHFMGHAFYKSKVEKGSKKGSVGTIERGKEGNQITHSKKAPRSKSKRDTSESSKASETLLKSTLLAHNIKGGTQRAQKKLSGNAQTKSVSLHPQKEDKKRHRKGHKKNMVVIQRPALIYHPPPEIYDRPDIIVHRPDFVIHQPSVVYHQPSVVVHRPPVIYNPPPVVFHQPSPMVHQPMYTAHDIYHSRPSFVPYSSQIKHTHTYVGAPHYYAGGWRYGYGFSNNAIPNMNSWQRWNAFQGPWYSPSLYRANYVAPTAPVNRRVLPRPNPAAFSKSRAFSKSLVEKHLDKAQELSKTHEKHSEKKHIKSPHRAVKKVGIRKQRSVEPDKNSTTTYHSLKDKLHKKGHQSGKGGKKNQVVLRRPPLVYHPPPEVYHKPDIIVHRPDIVLHQPSVVYHQPSVIVHRPPVIYNQPPVVFHQPAPMVRQPIFHAHEQYMAHPAFVPFTSHVQHSGTYLGAPNFFGGRWNYGYGNAFGKSHVLKYRSKSEKPKKRHRKQETRPEGKKGYILHPQKVKDEKASRKNDIVVSRPPIIYHPPPEIYHRPDIVVHRAPIVLHRPPIIYHQPPVVVHRPAVVYHQPPIVFHQPPPAVNQPILHSHDSFILRPAARFLPQGSTVTHSMSYVGIPNHVIHGDELDFHHFHRSHIEHSAKDKLNGKSSKPQITKSTISKTTTTKTENTETIITDQTQKKTLRSTINQHPLTKRQLMGSHSLYGSVSPINDVEDLHKSIEQKEKMSIIPGNTSIREHEVAKRSYKPSYDVTKRQLILPESTDSIPSVYNQLETAALQNQALLEAQEIPNPNGINMEHLPGFGASLKAIQELEGSPVAPSRFPLPLQQYLPATPKDDSPDVRVHVETAKSSIPPRKRGKRQLVPLYQQQGPVIPRVLYQAPNPGSVGVIHTTAPSSLYNLFNAYHPAYRAMPNALSYLSMVPQLPHRPHVNINVQSARSAIPMHILEKRSKDLKSKRQILALTPPVPRVMPLGFDGTGIIRNYPTYSPFATMSRLSPPLLPYLKYADSDPSEPVYPEVLPLLHQYPQQVHRSYNTLPEDGSSDSLPLSPWASYLAALYNSFLGYPLYHRHHKPKVRVEVQASKSHIPKVLKTENKHTVHSRAPITKRQLLNYIPESSFPIGHYTLPTALNYGVEGIPFHHTPRVNINVETTKKNGIPAVKEIKGSKKRGSIKHREENKTGEKRDEMIDGEQNVPEMFPNRGNPEFANAPENQFVATSETAESEEGPTSNNEGQPQGQEENFQQQSQEEEVGEREDLQQNSGQQLLPSQDQPAMEPSTSQPQDLRAFNPPLQLPVQQPPQSAFQVPFQAPFVVPFQGILPSALPVAPAIPVAEQPSSQQETEPEVVQPKHTSINVNVAEKSTVPKKRSKKRKHPLHKRQFLPTTQGYVPAYGVPLSYNSGASLPDQKRPRVSISVQTARRSTTQQPNNKRESISLLTRFPAMQVLPQTFKQNGVMMPAFNTLPINHKIKANGMLIEELQRQKKHKIPQRSRGIKTGKDGQISQKEKLRTPPKIRWGRRKENAKKRQFYAVPQSLSAGQQYPLLSRPNLQPRPRVSVNVEVSKRKIDFQKVMPQSRDVKRTLEETDGPTFSKIAMKRQVYGIDQPPHMVHFPVVGAPILTQTPVVNQRPRVSVHVETAKKKYKLSRKIDPEKEAERKRKRQIYGLSELPHEGLPVPLAGQGEALNGYFPITEHNPHVSVNVKASKRSDDDDDVIHKRQIFVQPVEQDQEQVAMTNGEESSQSQEPNQVGVIQSPTPEKEQFHSLPALIQSNAGATEPQQVEELSQGDAQPSRAGLSETDYERPRISVHVESSKRSKYERERKVNQPIGPNFRTAPWKGAKRQLQQKEIQREDYEPEQEATAANPGDLLQEQRPRVSVDVNVAKKKHSVTRISSSKKIKYHGHTAKASNPERRQIIVPFGGGINAIQGNPAKSTQFMMGKDQEENRQGVQEASMPLQSQVEDSDQQQQQQQQPTQQNLQPIAFLQRDQQQQQQFPAFQQAIIPVANAVEEKTRPKVSISVQTAKSSISKKDHARTLKSTKELPVDQKLRRQLFGTVPLLSSLGQSTLNGIPKENRRSDVPQSTQELPNHIQKGQRLWKRQLYNYLGGQQETQFVPTQSLQSATDAQQPRQALQIQPIQTVTQDDGAQLSPFNLPQASLLQISNQGSSQTYPTQVEAPESTEQASTTPIQPVESSSNLVRPFQSPRVSINVQTAKSNVPSPHRLYHDHGLKDNARNSKGKKFKRQLDLLGGGLIERRRGPKVLGGLKKPRPENLFGLGNNLNKPVEVFTDPISNLIGGGGAGRKTPKLGGIRLDSPTGVGALPLKGAATALESALPPELGASNILQDSPTEAVSPFTQETRIANEPLFRPPSGIAGPQLDTVEREGDRTNEIPLNDMPSMRPAVLPLPSINRVFLPNLAVPPAAPPQVNPLLLTPRVFPIGPLLPLPSPAPVPLSMEEKEPTEVPQVPPRFAPIFPPIFPLPDPGFAPNPALTAPDSLLPEPGDEKPSVHVNVETSRSSVPETDHYYKQHANSPAKRG